MALLRLLSAIVPTVPVLGLDPAGVSRDPAVVAAYVGDPLVHLVRNSLDHGIESPEERIEAGKPATGSIAITANQEGNLVTLEVRDDGPGLGAVSARAAERGPGS